MEIVHGRDLNYESGAKISKHRAGGIAFKHLAHGVDGTPENFIFVLGRQNDFYSPEHKHNFDQFRYAYQGDFNLKPHLQLYQGQLSYHPEGVVYGPQHDGPKERILAVLQCGGASGQGFMSWRELKRANSELSERGEFKQGKFYPSDGGEVLDGFQANWEYVNGRKLQYPVGRYHEPICMDPSSFAWRSIPNAKDAYKKHLGTFSERETKAEMIKIDSQGSLKVGGDNAIHLLFVTAGEGKLEAERLSTESTITLQAGVSCEINGVDGVELLHFVMPMLS